MILIFTFLFIIFLSISNLKVTKYSKISYFLVLVVLIIICSIRYRVGGDTLAYYDNFFQYPSFKELFRFDFRDAEFNPSWYIFNALSKSINDSFYTFQFLHAIVINGVVFWCMAKYSTNVFIVLPFYYILYFFYFNMEILRESLAVVFFLLSLPSFLKKNWFRYYLFALISLSFHNSALITFIFPLFYSKIRVKYQILIFILSIFVFGFLSSGDIILSIGLDKLFGSKSLFYLNKEMNIVGSVFQLLKLLPVYVIYYVSKKKGGESIFEKLVFPYIIIGIVAAFIPGIYRFLNYLSIPILIYCINQLYLFYCNRYKYPISYIKLRLSVFVIVLFQVFYLVQDQSELAKTRGARKIEMYLPFYSTFDERIHDNRERMFYNQFEGDF